jgi:lysophospholipase L1-like esterase
MTTAPSASLLTGILAGISLVVALSASAADPELPTVHLVGDSTMADRSTADGNPERGWGQLLPAFVREGVRVENHAVCGRSSRSFRDEGRWAVVLERLRPGDWVVIQFGHNDQKRKRPDLYTDPTGDFRDFLSQYVREARGRGARPVLATSIYRRYFDGDGKPKNTLGKYPEGTRAVADSLEVPLVDLHTLTRSLLERKGVEGSKDLFLHFEPGESPYFPKGKRDNSHLSETGARTVAELFAREIARLEIGFPLGSLTEDSRGRAAF